MLSNLFSFFLSIKKFMAKYDIINNIKIKYNIKFIYNFVHVLELEVIPI